MRVKEYFTSFDVEPISSNLLHGPITQKMINHLRQSNEEKRLRSIELLGSKWLLHPDNKKQKEINVRS